MERGKLIGIIHQRKAKAMVCDSCGRIYFGSRCPQCHTDGHRIRDEEYRAALTYWTGKPSCSQMDEIELRMVLTALDDAGYQGYWEGRKKDHQKHQIKTIQIIKREASRVLGDNWAERLEAFIDKVVGKPSIYSLDDRELRQVIGWLRRLKNRAMGNDRF